jgi:hypothetical protein
VPAMAPSIAVVFTPRPACTLSRPSAMNNSRLNGDLGRHDRLLFPGDAETPDLARERTTVLYPGRPCHSRRTSARRYLG